MAEQRALGKSGLTTPPLMLGGNVFGWTIDQERSFAVLDAFVGGGGRIIDTADVYWQWKPGNSGGESEAIIGAWLTRRGRRDDVLIATKVGLLEGPGGTKLQPGRIAEAVEASLKRLQTDYIDLYFAHEDDADTSQEEVAHAFATLVKAGKVRAIGASNFTPARLTSALEIADRLGTPRYTVVEPLYNLMERGVYDGPLQDLCVREGIGVTPFFGLAQGFLTGKYRSAKDLEGSERAASVSKYLDARGDAVLGALDAVAGETGAVPAQVALAWMAVQPGVTAPIASATSVAQVEQLLGAMELALSADQLDRLDRASRGAA